MAKMKTLAKNLANNKKIEVFFTKDRCFGEIVAVHIEKDKKICIVTLVTEKAITYKVPAHIKRLNDDYIVSSQDFIILTDKNREKMKLLYS